MKASSPARMNANWPFVLLATLLGVAGRLLPHLPNVTPIGGLSVWSGSRLTGWQRYAAVFLPLVVSDLFLGWHKTIFFVYGAFALTTWLASRNAKVTFQSVAGVTVVNAFLFYLITNFGVWLVSPLYPHTTTGLIESYVAGLPFLRFSLLGDAVYCALFFGLEWASRALSRNGSLSVAKKGGV